ncbi:MAG: hypothetical protein G01um101419_184 [Parcubacteria group bacterium Gr01-1014_19]|nr:MAG: hypothetical protein G01um101419_184 [Parcubacteria group bacterium Gr01-1014_19]
MRAILVLLVLYVMTKIIASAIGMDFNPQYPFWKVCTYNLMHLTVGIIFGYMWMQEKPKEKNESKPRV